jgi:NADH:ubiquinone oxidoreductase subunit 3 (subunit A)
MDASFLLTPAVAFLVYLGAAALLSGIGNAIAEPTEQSDIKSSPYASGNAPYRRAAAPGYQQFFVIALFFAILHLGVLVLGSGGITWMSAAYLVGLILALIALILG